MRAVVWYGLGLVIALTVYVSRVVDGSSWSFIAVLVLLWAAALLLLSGARFRLKRDG